MQKCAYIPRVVLFLCAAIVWLIVIQIAQAVTLQTDSSAEANTFNIPNWYWPAVHQQ